MRDIAPVFIVNVVLLVAAIAISIFSGTSFHYIALSFLIVMFGVGLVAVRQQIIKARRMSALYGHPKQNVVRVIAEIVPSTSLVVLDQEDQWSQLQNCA